MPCTKCGGGMFRYAGTQQVLTDNSIYKPLLVNVFICDNYPKCRNCFLVDKSSKNPKRKIKVKGQFKPRVDTNTKEETRIYNKMWIDSGGVYGVMPVGYVKPKSKVKRKK